MIHLREATPGRAGLACRHGSHSPPRKGVLMTYSSSGSNLRPEPRRHPSPQPLSTRGHGFVLGALVSAAFLIVLVPNPVLWRDPYDDSPVGWVALTFLCIALAIAVIGWVTGIVLAARRATTRLGHGMLLGMTVTMPLAVLFVIWAELSQSP